MLPQSMFPVAANPECPCPPVLLNSTMFGGVWRVDTDGNLTRYANVGAAVPDLQADDQLLLWGTVTETANIVVDTVIQIGSLYPGRQSLVNWDLAGFEVSFQADVVLHNLHIQDADGIKADLAGMTMRFKECFLALTGNFDPDDGLDALYTFEMEDCKVIGTNLTYFRLGNTFKKVIAQLRDTEFREIPVHFRTDSGGAIRNHGVIFFNNTATDIVSLRTGGTGFHFYEASRFYGKNAQAAEGVVMVEDDIDDLRITNSHFRGVGANTVRFESVNPTGVVFANCWAQNAGVTNALSAPAPGITIRGPNSTFDTVLDNVTVNP